MYNVVIKMLIIGYLVRLFLIYCIIFVFRFIILIVVKCWDLILKGYFILFFSKLKLLLNNKIIFSFLMLLNL